MFCIVTGVSKYKATSINSDVACINEIIFKHFYQELNVRHPNYVVLHTILTWASLIDLAAWSVLKGSFTLQKWELSEVSTEASKDGCR